MSDQDEFEYVNSCGYVLCFDPETQIKKSNQDNAILRDLFVGDEILTVGCGSSGDLAPTDITTVVTKIRKNYGLFQGLKFQLQDGKTVTVTTNHLMIILKDGEMTHIEAKDAQIYDVMYVEGGKLSKISAIEDVKIQDTMCIETSTGTLNANGILVAESPLSPFSEAKMTNYPIMESKTTEIMA